jgi:hypothetical protein
VRSVVALAVMLSSAEAAAARPKCALDVAIDPAAGTATGTVAIELENVSAKALDAIELWNFPARLGKMPNGVEEHNFYWLYPRTFSPGSMAVSEVTVDGAPARAEPADATPAGKGTLLRIPLSRPLPPGGHARVTARFATSVPRRFGAFGCVDGGCTLAGGFYPMPVQLGEGGWDESAPPARVELDARVSAPAGLTVIVNGAPSPAVHVADAAYAVVRVEPGLGARTLAHRGTFVTYFSHAGPPPPETPAGKAAPYLSEDIAQLVLDTVRDALETLAELGIQLPENTRLSLIEAPLRVELADPHSGDLLVSDQVFRLTPAPRFRKFHAFQLVRAVYAALLERALAAREQPDDLAWSPDVGASWMVDYYTVRGYHEAEFAQDVMKWVAFIPAVDRILYAPKIQFAPAYFNTLDDPDPTRDHMLRFANLRPRGKTIHEKLRDRIGDAGVARVVRATWQGTPLRAAVADEEAALAIPPPIPDRAFFAQWLGPYPEVDYRFELLETKRRSDGRGQVHTVRMWKRGANPPVEPVELRVTEWGGKRHDLKWDGQGAETRLTVETERSIQSIELDPRGRLLERITGENDDLRLDDRSPARIKFLYNNFGALINFQNLSLDLSLDFSLSRILDVKNSTRIGLYHSAATQIGGILGYSRSFGEMITPARLAWAAGLTLVVARLDPTFGLGPHKLPEPGTRFTLSTGLAYSDVVFSWDPHRGTYFGVSGSWSVTVHDNGQVGQNVGVGVALDHYEPIAAGHQLAFEVAAAGVFGDLHFPSQMTAAGAPNYLRGYEPDELLGRWRATARAEWRHSFVRDLNWNFFHVLYLRGVSGGVFAESGVVSDCDATATNGGGYGIGPDSLFADVGYSLRFHEDWFGVSQTLMNIDVAVPLVRHARGCFGDPGIPLRDPQTRAPVAFFLYWGPAW